MNKKDWKYDKIGNLCDVYNGNSINAEYKKKHFYGAKDGYPFIATKDVSTLGTIDYDNGVRIPNHNAYKVAPPSSVLVCAEGGSAGKKFAFVEQNICFGNKLFCLVAKTNVIGKFIYYFVQSPLFKSQFHSFIAGLIGGVSASKFKDICISYPPLSEQEEIVKKLDAAFAEIDALKANSESQLLEARALFQAALSKELSPKNNWQKRLIKDCCSIMAGGDVPKDHFSKEKTKQFQVPIFSNGTVNEGLYGFTDIPKITKKSITISGRGTIGFVAKRMEPFYPIVRLIVITPNDEIDVSFLKYYTMSIHLEKNRNGVAIPQLTVPMIKEVDICHPSLSEQEEIVARLDTLSDNVRKLEEINRRTIAECDALRQSILRQIFD